MNLLSKFLYLLYSQDSPQKEEWQLWFGLNINGTLNPNNILQFSYDAKVDPLMGICSKESSPEIRTLPPFLPCYSSKGRWKITHDKKHCVLLHTNRKSITEDLWYQCHLKKFF